MYPFIETIKINNAKVFLLEKHLLRMQKTCMEFYGKEKKVSSLVVEIEGASKEISQLTKLTIFYNLDSYKLEFKPYRKKKVEKIHIVQNDFIDYHLKYSDRNFFQNELSKIKANEEIFIIKNQQLTDASFANIALWNGNEWHTPTSPLLHGVKRDFYIEKKIIIPKNIGVEDLAKYEKVSLINAMLDLTELEIATNRIVY